MLDHSTAVFVKQGGDNSHHNTQLAETMFRLTCNYSSPHGHLMQPCVENTTAQQHQLVHLLVIKFVQKLLQNLYTLCKTT
jgi:hypothetical protein